MPRPALARLAALVVLAAAACGSDTPSDNEDAALILDLATPRDAAVVDGSAPDLAAARDLTPVSADQSAAVDLAAPPDATLPRDLAPPPPDQTVVSDDGGDQVCAAAGAAPGMALCCLATPDYPNQCKIGGCSCAPGNSHMVKICICPMGKCFNGVACQ